MPDNPNQPKPPTTNPQPTAENVVPQNQGLPQEPPPEPPIPEMITSASPPASPEPETPVRPLISPAAGGKGISKKLVVGLFALFFLLGSIPAAVFLVGQRQEIREKAATSAPDCPAGYTEVKVYGECCGYLKAKEVRECSAPTEEGGYTYTYPESDCVHDAPNCTAAAPTPTSPPAPATWHQCLYTNQDEPPENLPCGSCSVNSVGSGTMSFSCELDCGGSKDNYSLCQQTYNIAHRWERCQKAGIEACTGGSSDYIPPSGDLGGSGPWTIAGQSTVNGSGTFPNPGCGRVQVDVQIEGTGTSVDGKVYNTGKDCAPSSVPPSEPPPPSGGVSCNYDQVSLHVSPNPQQVGGSVTFSITGDASTYVQDSWTGGVDCQGDFASSKTCKATAAGNFSWTHQWRHCEGSFDNCSGVCSESANFTITAPPTYTHTCSQVKVYDTNWMEITNLANIKAGQTVRFTTSGQTSEPQGITKARIRVNNGAWQETTNKKPNTNEFYIDYIISAAGGSFTVESEVYNPTLGWK